MVQNPYPRIQEFIQCNSVFDPETAVGFRVFVPDSAADIGSDTDIGFPQGFDSLTVVGNRRKVVQIVIVKGLLT